jgi:hypothetical protein
MSTLAEDVREHKNDLTQGYLSDTTTSRVDPPRRVSRCLPNVRDRVTRIPSWAVIFPLLSKSNYRPSRTHTGHLASFFPRRSRGCHRGESQKVNWKGSPRFFKSPNQLLMHIDLKVIGSNIKLFNPASHRARRLDSFGPRYQVSCHLHCLFL